MGPYCHRAAQADLADPLRGAGHLDQHRWLHQAVHRPLGRLRLGGRDRVAPRHLDAAVHHAFGLGEIYANAAASQQLLDDSEIDIEAWLTGEIETEFSRQEGIAFLAGDGANKPYGLLTYVTGAANAGRHPWGDIKTVNSGAAAGFTTDAVVSTVYALPAMYEPNAKFFLNRSSLGAVRKLKDGMGNYIWQPTYVAGQPSTLVGRPVVDVPDMPNVAANNVAMLFGDMRETYLVIDRVGVRVLRDPYTNKPYICFYVTKRVGGGVQNPDAMKAVVISA